MALSRIRHVRAFTATGGGADYHDQADDHWIDDHIATPMSRYPEYRQSRRSFGINVLGTLVVEIEAEDGTVGFAVTTGGEPACYIVEKHLARFLEGRDPAEVEKIWDQMYFSTQYYGRKGLVVNAISGVDLALWDLLGKLRGEPVHALLGGAVRDELQFYVLTIPHGSSVYSYHFVATRHNSPFAEFLMMHPGPTEVVPMFAPQLLGEPVPERGRLPISALDKPGFGVELNPEVPLRRPYAR